jgi:large subunit ribosomal protein L32
VTKKFWGYNCPSVPVKTGTAITTGLIFQVYLKGGPWAESPKGVGQEMTVPKRRLSKMKGRKRRTHYVSSVPALTMCSCGRVTRPHMVCLECGMYRKREIFKGPKEEKE